MLSWLLPILGWGSFGLAIVIGLALDMLGLFGNWIILGAVGIAWAATDFAHFTGWALGVMLVLAILGEVLEMGLAGYGAKKFGGGKGSIVAALVGCLVGAVVGSAIFPIVGTLIGACFGAFLCAALYEYLQQEKEVRDALWTGVGAAIGKVGGLMAKLLCGLAMLALAAFTF